MIDIDSVIKGCLEGDPRMQRELYDRYSPFLYSLCRRYTADDDKAMEALVESFMLIFSNLENYNGNGSIKGWMMTITMRKIVDLYRRDRQWSEKYTDIDSFVGESLTPDYDRQIDLRTVLVGALRKLPPQDRALFNMIAVEGYSFSEAGKVLKLPKSTVKSRYYKARTQMQKWVRVYFGHVENIQKEQ